MAKYIVIAGAVPSVHKRRIVQPGEILDEEFFYEGEIPELIRGKFIKEYDEPGESTEQPETAATADEVPTNSKKKG